MSINWKILQGDCLEVLKALPSESVQTCVTSPPYFGLRDYGVEGQIGLEQSPAEYVSKLIEVFAEVWRVMREDGTLWLNLGDSYTASGGELVNGSQGVNSKVGKTSPESCPGSGRVERTRNSGLKPKNLMMIPHRVAIALQEWGWYVRQDIVWNKPNPMPESVTDRCTKSHEYIFLLTKSERYYFDNEAIKEPATESNWSARLERESLKSAPTEKVNGIRTRSTFGNRNGELEGLHSGKAYIFDGTRNKRSVWTVTTKPYSEAHFATFPEKLIEPCILAGSKEGDTVLDIFNGAGTTGVVSVKYGRNYIGIELNPVYIAIAEKRIKGSIMPLFESVG